jgi:hypothetical protein
MARLVRCRTRPYAMPRPRGADFLSAPRATRAFGRKRFFFEKKNQKTFEHWHTPPERLSPTSKSFFASFFSKKEDS